MRASLIALVILVLVAAPGGLLGGPAVAQTEIVVHYGIPDLFKEVHEQIARDFMARHKDIKVRFLAPAQSYEQAAEQVLRGAVTSQLPDVSYQGLNRQRIFVDRDLAADLGQFIAKERDWDRAGYDGALLTLGQVKGRQYGMGFSLSTPIVYFNADLVRKAGGDPDRFPATWEGIFELGRRIAKPEEKVYGFHFDWDITGNWMWQALVFSHGGSMLTPDEKQVAFDGPPGQKAIALLSRMVKEGTMRNVSQASALQDFVSGRLGIWSHSTSRLGGVTKQVGKTFDLRTARFPVYAGGESRLPAGGNVAMMFAKDPAKQKAAWEYIKFATGPQGATTMVKGTGYFPANALPARDPILLGEFYAQNPNHRTAIGQLPLLTAWYAFPGEHGLKITDVIKDHLQTVVAQAGAADQVLKKMTADVQALLPK